MKWFQRIRLKELGGLGIVIVSSLLILVGSISLPEPEYDPLGPAGVPRYIAWLMLGLALIFVIQIVTATVGDADPERSSESIETSRYVETGITVVAVLGYLVALTSGGFSFPIVTLIFLVVTGLTMTHFVLAKIPLIIVISAVVSFGLTYIFQDVLNVVLPG